MQSRNTLIIILAVVLMVLVMGVAAAITFSGTADRDRWNVQAGWTHAAPSAASMKVASITSASKTDLYVQAGSAILVFDASGNEVFNREFPGTLASALGDVNGDGIQEILVYYVPESDAVVAALRIPSGEPVWQTRVPGLTGGVGRVAVADFDGDGASSAVVADLQCHVASIAPDGRVEWRYDMQSSSELKGLDNILASPAQLVVAADTGGRVVALDGQGREAWQYNAAGGLRRLRTEELIGAGRSAALIGGETGTLAVLEGDTGNQLWTAGLGQAITEIRLAELDGDVATHELVAGGKLNGVWGFSQDGKKLFSARVGGSKTKITEIAALDASGSGRDVVAVGDDSGTVTFFDAQGKQITTASYSAPINRLASGKLTGQQQFVVADANSVRGVSLHNDSAPFWYTPLVAGLLACAAIAGVAYLVGSLKPAPTLQISAEQMTVEAQKARRLMLLEAIADVKRMQSAGEVTGDAYLARLKELRGQLADADAALTKLGVPMAAETFACPHCGGTLQLGTDRCDYCGQTVIIR